MLLTSLLFLAAIIVLHRLRDTDAIDTSMPVIPARKPKSRFRAVRVVPGASACASARNAQGQRVLLTAAPRLPLEHCDRIMRCRCRFRHHADRRSGDDRRAMFGSLAGDSAQGPLNRRAGVERRSKPPSRLEATH